MFLVRVHMYFNECLMDYLRRSSDLWDTTEQALNACIFIHITISSQLFISTVSYRFYLLLIYFSNCTKVNKREELLRQGLK